MKNKIHIRNCPSLAVLMEKYATSFTVEEHTYYELPFWFEKEGSGFVMHLKPPTDLKNFIMHAGLGNPNPQPIKKVK